MTEPFHDHLIVQARRTRESPSTRPGRIILLRLHREGPDRLGPSYATAWLGDGDTSWWRGEYFDSYADAACSFERRCYADC
jgi:hypothetical protein